MTAKVLSNLESLGELIGVLKGIEKGLDEDTYMEGLIRQAHGKASNAFNVAAAATGAAGHLTHVFEYGTAGITKGPVRHPDPTDKSARLWTHTITGHGGNQDIGYSFRPALTRNPQPTTRETGVPSKYLRKLSKRKYIFWNRAFVMETGRTVDIVPKSNGLLFIPFYGEPSMSERSNDRGYMMFPGNATLTPGRHTTGRFTSFWMKWWSAAGQDIMEQDIRVSITEDINRAMAEASKRAASAVMEPPSTTNVAGAVARVREIVESKFVTARRDVRTNE